MAGTMAWATCRLTWIAISKQEEDNERALTALTQRLPSRSALFNTAVACVFPIFAWSTVSMLREVPVWVLRLNAWDLIGMIAYNQAFALLESALVFLVLVLGALLLPPRWRQVEFHALATGMVFTSTAWFVLVHFNDDAIRLWGMGQFARWGLVYLASLAGVFLLIQRFAPVARGLSVITHRLSVLSVFYALTGAGGLLLVILRNLV